MKSKRLEIGLALALLGASGTAALACECRQPMPSPRTMLQKSAAVFVGKIVQVQVQRNSQGYRERRATFQVSRAWKGVASRTIVVATGWSEGACGCPFAQGGEFL